MVVCVVHTYEAVPPGFTGLPVSYHNGLVNVPESLEVFSERGVSRVVRQSADEDFGERGVFLDRCGRHDFQGSVHVLMQEHWSSRIERPRHTEN